MLRRQQLHLVAHGEERPRPMVRRAAGLHDDAAGRAVHEELAEPLPRQALALDDAPLPVGNREFKNRLCQIDRNGGSVHVQGSSRL